MKTALIGAIVAVTGLVAVASPAAARCAAGYEPVRVQGNWVCRLKTPKLPLKSNTQRKKAVYMKWDSIKKGE
jgi:hypothetical protein